MPNINGNINYLSFGSGEYSNYAVSARDGRNEMAVYKVISREPQEDISTPIDTPIDTLTDTLDTLDTLDTPTVIPKKPEPLPFTFQYFERPNKLNFAESTSSLNCDWAIDSPLIGAGTDFGGFHLWDFDTGALLYYLKDSNPVRTVKFPPIKNPPIVAFGTTGGKVYLLDLRKMQLQIIDVTGAVTDSHLQKIFDTSS